MFTSSYRSKNLSPSAAISNYGNAVLHPPDNLDVLLRSRVSMSTSSTHRGAADALIYTHVQPSRISHDKHIHINVFTHSTRTSNITNTFTNRLIRTRQSSPCTRAARPRNCYCQRDATAAAAASASLSVCLCVCVLSSTVGSHTIHTRDVHTLTHTDGTTDTVLWANS